MPDWLGLATISLGFVVESECKEGFGSCIEIWLPQDDKVHIYVLLCKFKYFLNLIIN